ncbi:MAG: hypothetical protein IKR57_00290 [Bacilli bacterium]|nr:hypothetical protein [Bacilli bacterium]
MKEEKKRYFLVEYNGNIRTTIANSREEVYHILNEVRKYNNRKSSKYLMGNIQIEEIDGVFYITAHLYTKYTNRMTISEIDTMTSKLTESELAKVFSDKTKMINDALPDINIAYLETENSNGKDPIKYERGIRYLPVLYKDDIKYMDKAYIRGCLYYHATIRDFNFFRDLANEFSVHHFIGDEVSELYRVVDYCENQNGSLTDVYIKAVDLYSKFICEYEKDESLTRDKAGKYVISRRRLRDFGFFVKNYNLRDSKIKSPLKYNMPLPKPTMEEEESGQLKLIL